MEQRNIARGLLHTAAFVIVGLAVGAGLGAVTKGVFQLFNGLIDIIWEWLPDQLGTDPTSLLYMASVLAIGGLLVGLGNKYLGYHPEALEVVMGRVKAGGAIAHATIPQTLLNSFAALGFGGPLGPEAALVATVGGLYYWTKGSLENQATTAYRLLTGSTDGRFAPIWLQAPTVFVVVGVVAGFRWLPGGIDTSFVPSPTLGIGSTALLAAATGVVGGILGVLTSRVEGWVRSFRVYTSRPLTGGVLGGIVVSAIAVFSPLVLFSGAEQMTAIFGDSATTGELLYSAGGKWVALMVVLLLGWKGGPIFPLMFVSGAAAVAIASLVNADGVVMYAAAIAASVAGALGSAILGVAVALLVAPTSLLVPIVVGATSAAVVMRIGERSMGSVSEEDTQAESP